MDGRDLGAPSGDCFEVAREVLSMWRDCYEDAVLLDGSWARDADAVALVHGLPFGGPRLSNLNGLEVRSPLAAATGTYTAERAVRAIDAHSDEGTAPRVWVHLYRACVPDLPGARGGRSSVQVYIKALEAAGLDVASNSSLFTGLSWPIGRAGVPAQVRVVTHQNVGLDPVEFARRTLVALGAAERAVRRREERAAAAIDQAARAFDDLDHEIVRLRERLRAVCDGRHAAPHHARAPVVAVAAASTGGGADSSSSDSNDGEEDRGGGADDRNRRRRHHRRNEHGEVTDAAVPRIGRREEEATRSARQKRRRARRRHRGTRPEERVWCERHRVWERIDVTCADASSAAPPFAGDRPLDRSGSCCSGCCSSGDCTCSSSPDDPATVPTSSSR